MTKFTSSSASVRKKEIRMSRNLKLFVPLVALVAMIAFTQFGRADDAAKGSAGNAGNATISGKVLDPDGKPAANVLVRLLAPQKDVQGGDAATKPANEDASPKLAGGKKFKGAGKGLGKGAGKNANI